MKSHRNAEAAVLVACLLATAHFAGCCSPTQPAYPIGNYPTTGYPYPNYPVYPPAGTYSNIPGSASPPLTTASPTMAPSGGLPTYPSTLPNSTPTAPYPVGYPPGYFPGYPVQPGMPMAPYGTAPYMYGR
jgi:hypothetical protein